MRDKRSGTEKRSRERWCPSSLTDRREYSAFPGVPVLKQDSGLCQDGRSSYRPCIILKLQTTYFTKSHPLLRNDYMCVKNQKGGLNLLVPCGLSSSFPSFTGKRKFHQKSKAVTGEWGTGTYMCLNFEVG